MNREAKINNPGCIKCKWYYFNMFILHREPFCLNPNNIDHSKHIDFMPDKCDLNRNRKCNFFELENVSTSSWKRYLGKRKKREELISLGLIRSWL